MVKYGILHPAWGDFLRFSTSSPFFQPSPLYSPFLHVFSFPSHSKPKSLLKDTEIKFEKKINMVSHQFPSFEQKSESSLKKQYNESDK